MNVIKNIQDSPGVDRPTIVTVGVFDGVHVGHQAVLNMAVSRARAAGITSCVFTFDRHPAQLFAPDKAPFYLSSLDERVRLIGEFGGGVDVIAIARFDREFSSLSPIQFIEDILVRRLRCQEVFVGADFRFGARKSGDVDTLVQQGVRYGFVTSIIESVEVAGDRVSSTQIRNYLADGYLNEAVRMLGHTFSLTGRVVAGKQLGRTIGFPTANIVPLEPRHLVPSSGVYACYAHTENQEIFRAAVSVGTNPTTDTDGATKIEAYLLDGFNADIYGQLLTLEFAERLRSEVQFISLGELVAQIARDVEDVQKLAPGSSRHQTTVR